jgi:vacuolar-type H+-ATPase subunit I/STV1
MRATSIVLGIILFLAISVPASAEFYRYVDKHGNVLYTDDLSKVPADQRAKAQAYDESHSQPDKPQASPAPKVPGPNAAEAQALEAERKQLEEQEQSLNREYDDLMKQRATLDEEKINAVTQAQIKEHNQKIVELNSRIKAYEGKRDAYSEKVKAFNERAKDQSPKDQK